MSGVGANVKVKVRRQPIIRPNFGRKRVSGYAIE